MSSVDINKIKSSWQSLSDASLKKEVAKPDIEKMMRKKSKSELRKILTTFIVETVVCIPILILIWIGIHHSQEQYSWLFDVFMCVAMVLVLYPVLRLFKIGKFHDYATLPYLERFIGVFDYIIRTILNRAKWLLVFAGPLGAFMGVLSSGAHMNSADMIVVGVAILLYIPFGFGLYFILKWYYKRFYGRRVDTLRDYCEELQKDISE